MKKWVISFIIAAIASLSLLAPVHVLKNQYAEQAYHDHRNQATEHLTFVRNDLQSKLDSSLFYADFFEMIIRQNPQISDYELREYARFIMERNSVIENVTVSKGDTITFVYPYYGNEELVGTHFHQEEESRYSISSVEENGVILSQSPAESSQEGMKIFNHKPIYTKGISSENQWGYASVTVDFEELVHTTLSPHQQMDYHYVIQPNTEDTTDFIWGNRNVFELGGIMQSLVLPESKWTIGLVPVNGWRTSDGLFHQELMIFYSLISIIFCLVYFFSLQYVTKRELSRKDPLTGAYNKHTFEALARRLIKYSTQKNGILLIDFNDFKQINDQYGHLVGDKVLQECSIRMREIVKKSDRVGRIGGDEFMIITRDVDNEQNLRNISERIISHIQQPIYYHDIKITPSISVGFLLTNNLDVFENLYDAVDKKMYAHKEVNKKSVSELA